MGKDVAAAYEQAAKEEPRYPASCRWGWPGTAPSTPAWPTPIPMTASTPGKVNLWAYDHYHASAYGYYLEALLEFGKVTGNDPLALDGKDRVAEALGISPAAVARPDAGRARHAGSAEMKRCGFALAFVLAATPARRQDHPVRRQQLHLRRQFGGALLQARDGHRSQRSRPDRQDDGRRAGLLQGIHQGGGLDYTVSLETVGGKGMDYHYAAEARPAGQAVGRGGDAWLFHPGHRLIPAIRRCWCRPPSRSPTCSARKNAKAEIWLDATWSRADQTYPDGKPWHGKPIQQMGIDIAAGYAARRKAPRSPAWCRWAWPGTAPSIPAWRAAIPMPASRRARSICGAGISYHASAYGYYLEALLVFAKVTGKDPLSLGDSESVAEDMGFSKPQTHALQQIAHDQLAASHWVKPNQGCRRNEVLVAGALLVSSGMPQRVRKTSRARQTDGRR